MAQETKKSTPIVAVINMKGGVGKTTLTANVFREIFRRKSRSTLLVDFDPQFNLSQLLLTGRRYDELKTTNKTILSALEPPIPDSAFITSEASVLREGEICIDEYTCNLKHMSSDHSIVCRLLPGDFGLARFNLREDQKSLNSQRSRFAKLISSASETYSLVAIDCNPSSSFLTRSALEVATHIVIPVRPTRYSMLGVEMIVDYVEQLVSIPKPIPYTVIINDVVNDQVNQVESTLRAHGTFGPNVLASRVPHSKLLAAKHDYSGFATDQKLPYTKVLRDALGRVADELATRIGVEQ